MKLQLAVFWVVLSVAWAAVLAEPDLARLSEPVLDGDTLEEPRYGDDEIVAMLGSLVTDDDPLTRVWAVLDLGEAHNPSGLTYIRRALGDSQLTVRQAAVNAAVEIGCQNAEQIVIDALKAKEPDMLLVAMAGVGKLHLVKAAQDVLQLLAMDDAFVQAAALKTLTRLGRPAGQGELARLLGDTSTRVRLAAAQNALLLETAGQELAERLQEAAGEANPPAIRSASLEALGKFVFTDSRVPLHMAGKDANPLVRRGAVRAYRHAGQGELAGAFLNDEDAIVRLEAIRAAGDFRMAGASERLMSLMLTAEDPQTHSAARLALSQIGGQDVAKRAADTVVQLMEAPSPSTQPAGPATQARSATTQATTTQAATRPQGTTTQAGGEPQTQPDQGPKVTQAERNVASCCRLLGELKSTEGYKYQLGLLAKLPVESPILVDLVPAIAGIGDRQAVRPLMELLGRCQDRGSRYLTAMMSGGSPPPYEPQVVRKTIEALAEMKAYEAVDAMLNIANLNVRGSRLSDAACPAAKLLPELVQEPNRAKISSFLVMAIGDKNYSLATRFCAAKSAGKMKIQAALKPLQETLNEERPGKTLMHAAAWAIQEIAGQAPPIPQPRLRQGDWIVTKTAGK